MSLGLVGLLSACKERNPDVCCETATECGKLGFDSPQPCELGVCVGSVCASAGCDGDEDCESPTKFCVDATCVACRDSEGCARDVPVCDPETHSCRRCQTDEECASGVCDISTGNCADENAIRFASPGGSTTTPCTRAAPCSVAQALSTVDGEHPYVLMTPGTYTVGGTLNGKVAIVVGQDATLNVLDSQGELQVAAQGNLSIRHLSINVAPGAVEGVRCLETSTVNISDVQIVGGAITANGCQNMTVTSADLTDSIIGFNDGGLVSAGLIVDRCRFERSRIGVGGGSFFARITNSLLVPSPGTTSISLLTLLNTLPTVDTLVAYNTIVGGNVQCSNPAMSSRSRIFTGNLFVDQSSPLPKASACRYDYNDVLPADFALGGIGNINMDPKFVDPAAGDYHLQLGSPAIDAADPTSTNDHDLDGATRPQNGRSDMGAFERGGPRLLSPNSRGR